MRNLFFVCVFWAVGSLSAADSFPSIVVGETTYTNCTVTAVEPDGLKITHDEGITKIPYEQLPSNIQKQYNFDRVKAESYRAEKQKKADENQILLKQNEAAARQKQNERIIQSTNEATAKIIHVEVVQVLSGGAILGRLYDSRLRDLTLPGQAKTLSEEWFPTNTVIYLTGLNDNPADGQQKAAKAVRVPKNYSYTTVEGVEKNVESWQVVKALF